MAVMEAQRVYLWVLGMDYIAEHCDTGVHEELEKRSGKTRTCSTLTAGVELGISSELPSLLHLSRGPLII